MDARITIFLNEDSVGIIYTAPDSDMAERHQLSFDDLSFETDELGTIKLELRNDDIKVTTTAGVEAYAKEQPKGHYFTFVSPAPKRISLAEARKKAGIKPSQSFIRPSKNSPLTRDPLPADFDEDDIPF